MTLSMLKHFYPANGSKFTAQLPKWLLHCDYIKLKQSNKGRVFTALHGMQSRYSDGNSVCLSVCPSVCLSVCLSNACIVTKRKKNLSRFLYHAKDHSVYFYEKKNGWWGDPFYLKFWVNRSPLERNCRFSTDNRS